MNDNKVKRKKHKIANHRTTSREGEKIIRNDRKPWRCQSINGSRL